MQDTGIRSVEHYRDDETEEQRSNAATEADDPTDVGLTVDDRPVALSVEGWLREGTGHAVRDVQTRYRERVAGLESNPSVRDVAVRTWPTRVFRGTDAPSDRLNGTLSRMQAWADREERSLAPAFRRRVVRSPLAGDRREEVTLPIVCLAVYERDALVGVFPHRADGRVYTVEDFLDWCERAEPEEPEERPRSPRHGGVGP